jgi:microcystin degradation protein MlrC
MAMVDGIKAAGPLDAVYLDLHGAMVTEHLDDGEGEILARVRQVIGKELPLVVSLDLHANVTPEMVEHADALIAYRTYPHVDMADTGRAAARHLALLLSGHKFAKAFRQLPFLIPISWQCTNDQPTKAIYEELAALESDAVPTLSFAPGFPAADFPHCGPSVFAYGRTQADADAAVDQLTKLIIGREDDFDGRIYTPDEGVRHAMELASRATRPVIIADTQDNPGAGGDSDTTGMLRALVRNHATNAAIGVIYDPQSAQAAHAAGVGATVTLALGGKSGIAGDAPYKESFVVEQLSDGKFVAPGPYYGGRDMDMGPSASLRIGGVRVVVSSHKAQLADQSMYRYVGIEPSAQSILVNKSSVHFRADFEPIAETLLICAAPGAMPADTAALPWTRLRAGIRTRPNGPAFVPEAKSRSTSSATG